MPLVDCHCHLEDKRFEKDREEVIERNKKAVDFVVNSGVDFSGNTATLEMHHEHPAFIKASLGLAPPLAAKMGDKDVDNFIELIKEHRDDITAIGEVGLDYHWTPAGKGRERQKEVFKKFIALAEELKKPLVVHCRDAMPDLLKIIGKKRPDRVMMHHFSGSGEEAQECLDHGFYISLCTGSKDKRLIKLLPLEYTLVETDSPYNCPMRGKRNEPFFVRDIVALVSTLKEVDATDYIFENALRFFAVPARTV
ncbi:MAG: TatD family hydrolase [Candidatus Diapherotrites archaeon]|nr:TatD family hydrolase [Candidatus Diapherotrites archaeon]